MNDERLWNFERSLWTEGPSVYDAKVAEDAVMALPAQPYVFNRDDAVHALKDTPVWEAVEFKNRRVERHQEGLIAIAYRASATRGDEEYHALCTSVHLRLGHDNWVCIQHQQTPLGVEVADPDAD